MLKLFEKLYAIWFSFNTNIYKAYVLLFFNNNYTAKILNSHQNRVQKIRIFASMLVYNLITLITILTIIQVKATTLIAAFSVRITIVIAIALPWIIRIDNFIERVESVWLRIAIMLFIRRLVLLKWLFML